MWLRRRLAHTMRIHDNALLTLQDCLERLGKDVAYLDVQWHLQLDSQLSVTSRECASVLRLAHLA
jgi:hypothetical protein